MSHFNERCRERGITRTDPGILFEAIASSVREHDKGRYQERVEYVFTHNEGRFFRFRCEDGIFYAVVPTDGVRPVTVFTQAMMRAKRRARKTARLHKRDRKTHVVPKKSGRAEDRRQSGWCWRSEA